MEHRQSMRVATGTWLQIYKKGIPVATGHLRDLSKHGLFLRTDFNDVRENEILQVEISDGAATGRSYDPISAVVIHKDEDGLGLMLAFEHQSQGLPELYSWLRHRSHNNRVYKDREKTGKYVN